MSTARHNPLNSVAAHAVLLAYVAIALFPVFVIIINSFKARKAIFREPLALPNSEKPFRVVTDASDFALAGVTEER